MLKESASRMAVAIARDLVPQLNKYFKDRLIPYENAVKSLLRDEIEASETYQSLMDKSGKSLSAELGFVLGQEESYVKPVVDKWLGSTKAVMVPFIANGPNIAGGVELVSILADFSDVLLLDKSTYVSNAKYNIDWLNWLLTKGSEIIITDHRITYNLNETGASLTNKQQKSRSRRALMVKNGSWVMPFEHAGTLQDNWITRIIGIEGSAFESKLNVIQARIFGD